MLTLCIITNDTKCSKDLLLTEIVTNINYKHLLSQGHIDNDFYYVITEPNLHCNAALFGHLFLSK